MAEEKIIEIQTAMPMEQNPYGKKVWPNTRELEKELKPKPDQKSRVCNECFPAEKTLVKTMMFRYIFKKFSVFFKGQSSSEKASKSHKGKK